MPLKELNTQFCTLDDVSGVIQSQNEINNLFQTIIEGGSAVDTFKLLVNGSDISPDYLHAKLNDPGTFLEDSCCVCNAQTLDDSTERLFWSAENILGYDAGASLLVLALGSGALAWLDVGTTVDDKKVLVTAGDTVASYLHDAFNLNATYFTNADLLVATATVGASSTNQHEQLFVDVSAIAGWDASAFRILTIEGNESEYISIDDLGDLLIANTTFIIDLEGTLADKFRLICGTVTGPTNPDIVLAFAIDNVEALANGTDPSGGDPDVQISVWAPVAEWRNTGDVVYAAWDGTKWVAIPERSRSMRGIYVSTTDSTHIVVNTLRPLCSGADPNSGETLTFVKEANQHFTYDDIIEADYDSRYGVWRCRQTYIKPVIYSATITGTISHGTATVPIAGTADIYRVNSDGTTTSVGSRTVYNSWASDASGHVTVAPLTLEPGSEKFLITGPSSHTCASATVVTSVSCVGGNISYTTSTINYASGPC